METMVVHQNHKRCLTYKLNRYKRYFWPGLAQSSCARGGGEALYDRVQVARPGEIKQNLFWLDTGLGKITVAQGRSCKQICWPPGVGGLQRVGLDPGHHDHHPHGVVHVGRLQYVQTIVPVIQEAHLGLITVSSSVMQFCNLLLFCTQEPGVMSWVEPLPRLVEPGRVWWEWATELQV